LFKNQAKPWDTKDIPILCEDMAQFLIHYYTKGRARKKHFKQGSIDKAVADLESAVRNRKYVAIPLRPNVGLNHFPGGDFTIQPKHIRCAACGEVVLKKESHKRLAVFLK